MLWRWTLKICLRQLIRPDSNLNIEGVGDCTMCKKDKENKKCKMYYPITVQNYTVSCKPSDGGPEPL
jgi:hypothetical protein